MLANGRIALWFELSLTFCFAFSIWLGSGWLRSVGSLFLKKSGFLPYCFWNMLLDAFLKPLSSATYVPTIIVKVKAVRIYSTTVSVRSKPAVIGLMAFLLTIVQCR